MTDKWSVLIKYNTSWNSSIQIRGESLTELILQPPDALLPRSPAEVADAPQQLSEDGRLLLAQSWLEILQHFLGGGLPVHTGLEGYEVVQIGQKFVVVGGQSRGGAGPRLCGELVLFLYLISLAGRQAEVIAGSHFGQQGGGGELSNL